MGGELSINVVSLEIKKKKPFCFLSTTHTGWGLEHLSVNKIYKTGC